MCFKQLAVGIYGPASPVTVISFNTQCSSTALVRAYSDFVIRGMNLQTRTLYASSAAVARRTKVTVTFMARRASTVWPEKRFCNDTHSFFQCSLWESFGVRALGRMLRNEADVIAGLRALEKEAYSNGARVTVRDVDYNLLTFREQIETDVTTDVMVGPHGAGLMHSIFMSDRAALVELFVDGSGGNRHFHNIAKWYGRTYSGETHSNPIDVNAVVQTVRRIINDMKL